MRQALFNVVLVTILCLMASGAVAGDCRKIFAPVDYVNLDSYLTNGSFASTFFVVGGTGTFEGATGWLGNVGDEVTGKGILRGEICTP